VSDGETVTFELRRISAFVSESMAILTPVKLFLDTNHLCQIVKLRKGNLAGIPAKHQDAYRLLNARILTGRVGLIFHLMAAVEWVGGQATLETANDIADVLDSAPLTYHVEADTFVFTRELLDECHRSNANITVPLFDVHWCRNPSPAVTPAIFTLPKLLPDVFHLSHPTATLDSLPFGRVSARLAVERAFNLKTSNPDLYNERGEGFAAAMMGDLNSISQRTVKTHTFQDFEEWARRYLSLDRILKALNPDIDIGATLSSIHIGRPEFEQHRPATALFFKYRMKKLKESQPVKKGDVGDAEFLQVIPFADIVLTDKNHRHFIVNADPALRDKVHSDPNECANRLRGTT
jgi:hypothetical protein